jgi:1,4-dihydroxy-2-naphthoyl-CoA hydrolase
MKTLWCSGITLEALQRRCERTLSAHLGIQLVELGEDFLRGAMPVDERTCQPLRVLHGGASLAFAETLASLAASATIDAERFFCLGQEINANHLRPVPEGSLVSGTARPFHIGRRSQVWGVDIFDQAGRRTCVSRMTVAVLAR